MAEYIDREALGIGYANPEAFPERNRLYAEGWNQVIKILLNAPTADVAPVVRCKECANFRQNPHGVCYCNEYGGAITPEDYCSRAVRKSELPAR